MCGVSGGRGTYGVPLLSRAMPISYYYTEGAFVKVDSKLEIRLELKCQELNNSLCAHQHQYPTPHRIIAHQPRWRACVTRRNNQFGGLWLAGGCLASGPVPSTKWFVSGVPPHGSPHPFHHNATLYRCYSPAQQAY